MRQVIGSGGRGLREVVVVWETERFKVSGESFCRDGTDGKVWRERLLWRLALLVSVEEVDDDDVALLSVSEGLLVSETKSFF